MEEGEAIESDKPKRLVVILLGKSTQDAILHGDALIQLMSKTYATTTNQDDVMTLVDVFCIDVPGVDVLNRTVSL